jgi:hypothetical protein
MESWDKRDPAVKRRIRPAIVEDVGGGTSQGEREGFWARGGDDEDNDDFPSPSFDQEWILD